MCAAAGPDALPQCYIGGNTHPTLLHCFGNRAGASADSSVGRDNGRGLYELNLWMWRYERGQSCSGKVTVTEADSVSRGVSKCLYI
jgi:hypothetical protein